MVVVSDKAPNTPFLILDRLEYRPGIDLPLRVKYLNREYVTGWRMRDYWLYENLSTGQGDGLW